MVKLSTKYKSFEKKKKQQIKLIISKTPPAKIHEKKQKKNGLTHARIQIHRDTRTHTHKHTQTHTHVDTYIDTLTRTSLRRRGIPKSSRQICPMRASRVRFYYVKTLKVKQYCRKKLL